MGAYKHFAACITHGHRAKTQVHVRVHPVEKQIHQWCQASIASLHIQRRWSLTRNGHFAAQPRPGCICTPSPGLTCNSAIEIAQCSAKVSVYRRLSGGHDAFTFAHDRLDSCAVADLRVSVNHLMVLAWPRVVCSQRRSPNVQSRILPRTSTLSTSTPRTGKPRPLASWRTVATTLRSNTVRPERERDDQEGNVGSSPLPLPPWVAQAWGSCHLPLAPPTT